MPSDKTHTIGGHRKILCNRELDKEFYSLDIEDIDCEECRAIVLPLLVHNKGKAIPIKKSRINAIPRITAKNRDEILNKLLKVLGATINPLKNSNLRDALGLTSGQTASLLRELKYDGLVEQVGEKANSRYQISEEGKKWITDGKIF